MIYRRTWQLVPLILLGGSLGLHLITVLLFTHTPDRFAAFTVFPVWVWGGIGLILSGSAFLFLRARLSLIVSLVWAVTIFLLADEARSLGRLGHSPPLIGSRDASIRVVTFNCHSGRNLDLHLAPYLPDIIFLQEIRSGYHAKKLVEKLFNGQGDYRHYARRSCAVIVRGKIAHYLEVPGTRCQLVTARLHNGVEVQLMNVHLSPATTNLRLWRRDCWRAHYHNRLRRRTELAYQLAVLKQKTPAFRLPTIIAGDFNAPANDASYDLFGGNFVDTFASVGSGWGNSYPSTFPIVRIDHIFSTTDLIPERCAAITIPGSDHRMIVADILPRQN